MTYWGVRQIGNVDALPQPKLILTQLLGTFGGVFAKRDQMELHCLRRSGATAAYTAGVDTHIKRRGTWSSDAFWQYITTNAMTLTNSPVALGLKQVTLQQCPVNNLRLQ